MKYEFIFKIREYQRGPYIVKYRCVVDPERYDTVLKSYEKVAKAHPEWDPIILINELDESGSFVGVIQ